MAALYLVTPENQDQSISDQALHLAEEFSYECGFKKLPYMVQEMTRYLLAGFESAMISEAIRRTARAPRPSFAYLAAIMRNAAAANQFDYVSYAASGPKPKKSSSHFDSERHYTEDDMRAASQAMIDEMRNQHQR